MSVLTRIAKLLRRPGSIPAVLKGIGHNLANDLRAIGGRYRYPHPVIFIAGLPKSGTTWVQNQLARIPGYNVRRIHDPSGAANTRDVSEAMFRALPRSRYSIVKLHTRYSDANFAIISAHVPRFVVMMRDLRDMALSRYYHVKNDRSSPHHYKYRDATLEEGLMDSIEVLRDNYVPWVADWNRIALANPSTVKLIRYEALSRDPAATFRELLEFYGIEVEPALLDSMANSRLKVRKDLASQLASNTWIARSTEREGEIGGWKKVFTAAHKQRFKEIAGAQLIELGYEKDSSW